jgi:hypothetical protein
VGSLSHRVSADEARWSPGLVGLIIAAGLQGTPASAAWESQGEAQSWHERCQSFMVGASRAMVHSTSRLQGEREGGMSMDVQEILVPVDYSDDSAQALQ